MWDDMLSRGQAGYARAWGGTAPPEAGGPPPRQASEGQPEPGSPLFSIHEDKAWQENGPENELRKRIEKFGKAKEHSRLCARWGIENLEKTFAKPSLQEGCGKWVNFRRATSGPDQAWKLRAGRFCQQTHTCQVCAILRGGRTLGAVVPKVLAALESRPAVRPYLITLTVPNGDDLRATLDRLLKSLGRMMWQFRDAQRRKTGSKAMRPVVGGVGQVEIKRGAGGQWHPHYHGLWLVDRSIAADQCKPLDYSAMYAAWCQAVEAPHANWNAQPLRSEKKRHLGAGAEAYREALIGDLLEVIKYTVKFESDGNYGDYWTIAGQVRRKQLLRAFGILRGIEVPEELIDEQLNWEELEFIDRFYRYAGGAKYVEVSAPKPHKSFEEWNDSQEN